MMFEENDDHFLGSGLRDSYSALTVQRLDWHTACSIPEQIEEENERGNS